MILIACPPKNAIAPSRGSSLLFRSLFVHLNTPKNTKKNHLDHQLLIGVLSINIYITVLIVVKLTHCYRTINLHQNMPSYIQITRAYERSSCPATAYYDNMSAFQYHTSKCTSGWCWVGCIIRTRFDPYHLSIRVSQPLLKAFFDAASMTGLILGKGSWYLNTSCWDIGPKIDSNPIWA